MKILKKRTQPLLNNYLKFSGILLVIAALCYGLESCGSRGEVMHLAIYYNCENLYNPTNNPLTDDDEFTPDGRLHYTEALYEKKVLHIAQVIRSMAQQLNNDQVPLLIGLSEVEDSVVLHKLITMAELRRYPLLPILLPSGDKRGINNALLVDSTQIKIVSATTIPVQWVAGADTNTSRNILYLKGLCGADTIHVYVNHWPSQKNDDYTTGHKAAQMALRAAISMVCQGQPDANIVVMGDFNENPNDSAVQQLTNGDTGAMYNPFVGKKENGTEYYNGEWNLFNQIWVSNHMRKDDCRLQFSGHGIYSPPFLRQPGKDTIAPPWRFFTGSSNWNGYSDHFPVWIELKKH